LCHPKGLFDLIGHGIDTLRLNRHREKLTVSIEDLPSLRGEVSRNKSLAEPFLGKFSSLDDLDLNKSKPHTHPSGQNRETNQRYTHLRWVETSTGLLGGHVSEPRLVPRRARALHPSLIPGTSATVDHH
jgi:hypothetical protein